MWLSTHDRMHMMVSQSLLVTDSEGMHALGMAHMREDGTWKLYGGDHDFMHPDEVVYWMPFPDAPGRERPACA